MSPWDSLYGQKYCVLRNGWILMKVAALLVITSAHLATPRQSYSWVRWPPLRDWGNVAGVPGLNEKYFKLVATGNVLVDFMIIMCLVLYAARA